MCSELFSNVNVGSRTAWAKSVWVCHRETGWESSETAETRSSHCLFSLVWVYFLRERFESSFRDLTLYVKILPERWQKWQKTFSPNQKKGGQERICGQAAVLDVLAVQGVVRVLCNICDRWAIEWGTQDWLDSMAEGFHIWPVWPRGLWHVVAKIRRMKLCQYWFELCDRTWKPK